MENNATQQDRPLAKERDERCVPIARALLLALASHKDLQIGSNVTTTPEKITKCYGDFYAEVAIPLFMEKDLKLSEVGYVFSIMSQAIDLAKGMTEKSLDANRDIADARLYGVDNIDELTLKQLDDVLKRDVDNSPLDEKKGKKV